MKNYIIIKKHVLLTSILLFFIIISIGCVEEKQDISISQGCTDTMTGEAIPIQHRETPQDVFSNDEIREAINFCRIYMNDAKSLKKDYNSLFNDWDRFFNEFLSNEAEYMIIRCYNNWLISYAFGEISSPITDEEINIIIIECINIDTGEGDNFEAIRYKTTPFENYTYNEVKQAIRYSKRYLSNPKKFATEKGSVFYEWTEYEHKICPCATEEQILEYYNYWIIAYSFGI